MYIYIYINDNNIYIIHRPTYFLKVLNLVFCSDFSNSELFGERLNLR